MRISTDDRKYLLNYSPADKLNETYVRNKQHLLYKKQHIIRIGNRISIY